jgi:tryptophan synthase alpha chain
MSRYQSMFENLALKKQGAFIPFVVLGDPDLTTSKKIITTLIEAGADALELGIAFSDPVADGPVIQKAGLRALRSGSNVENSLNLVKEVRDLYPHIPIGILTYANLVVRRSMDWFYSNCHRSGVDSVLVADVPIGEAKPFCDNAKAHNIDPVLIAPINLPKNRCRDITELSRGYTYVVTRKGVTGADQKLNLSHDELLKELKSQNAPPPVFGFGIATPAHVSEALSQGAKGAISGSKVVSIIEDFLGQEHMYDELAKFTRLMKDATLTHGSR